MLTIVFSLLPFVLFFGGLLFIFGGIVIEREWEKQGWLEYLGKTLKIFGTALFIGWIIERIIWFFFV
jgi:hypothetical protein